MSEHVGTALQKPQGAARRDGIDAGVPSPANACTLHRSSRAALSKNTCKTGSNLDNTTHNIPIKKTFEHRWRLFDMHCHLDRVANGDEVAREAAANGIALFCTAVSPADTLSAQTRFGTMPNIRVGMGLHPWWVADGRCGVGEIEQAAQLAGSSRFIGEVGLDFGPRHAASAQRQLDALEAIARACAENPVEGRALSVHAVRSASEAIDVLEYHGLTASAHCIFHWFSGTSDQLTRALGVGCFFSVSERMLATKRGREYARQIPLDRLLLETDAPNQLDTPYSAGQIESSLMRAIHITPGIQETSFPSPSNRRCDM